MKMVMYKNSRLFGGKAYAYEGFTGSMKAALQAARDIKRNKGYSVRIVKVRDGYNLYSRKLR